MHAVAWGVGADFSCEGFVRKEGLAYTNGWCHCVTLATEGECDKDILHIYYPATNA